MKLQAAKSHLWQRPRRHEPDGPRGASLASAVFQKPIADRTETVVVSFDEDLAQACIGPSRGADGEGSTCSLCPRFTLRRQVVSRTARLQVKPFQNFGVIRGSLDCGEIALVHRTEDDDAVRKRRIRRYETHVVENATARRLRSDGQAASAADSLRESHEDEPTAPSGVIPERWPSSRCSPP